ncbi:hypothetical protein SDC9_142218 [bioreactor metagenome]|uniref:Uncharacterized protein n=1 Tax=bioreactor metagenome TaxID=1076179 RepID=A0A645E091_9ZZZZ
MVEVIGARSHEPDDVERHHDGKQCQQRDALDPVQPFCLVEPSATVRRKCGITPCHGFHMACTSSSALGYANSLGRSTNAVQQGATQAVRAILTTDTKKVGDGRPERHWNTSFQVVFCIADINTHVFGGHKHPQYGYTFHRSK